MWHWDQGRLDYFQFDALRKIAKFATTADIKAALNADLVAAVGLPFSPNSPGYERPWRNYQRVFKLSLLAFDDGGIGRPTALAKLLSDDGKVTSDEYFHFLAEATTDPSPALQGWDATAALRYPLLFSLKYALARAAVGEQATSLDQIIDAYAGSGFIGDEDQTAFLGIIDSAYPVVTNKRQAIESLRRVLAQISYLTSDGDTLTVSLDKSDAHDIFDQLDPVGGPREEDGNQEIARLAALFPSATADLHLDYSNTVVSDAVEAGFAEGNRVERTHLKIERNSKLREAFFAAYPSAKCHFCEKDTAEEYPWVERVLDIHHVLPLCSGTRTTKDGTALGDLVANCPSCHRAVHRYYGQWLKAQGKKDFSDAAEARAVYEEAKEKYVG